MTSTRRRLVVLLLAIAVLMPLLQKSRSVSPVKRAVFLRYTAGACLIKVVGAGQRDGIYRFSDGITLVDVKKMTGAHAVIGADIRGGDGRFLQNGDVVTFNGSGDNNLKISLVKMTVTERVALGIPLDPDAMSAGDWEALPGIGPALAKEIVANRQKYGAFCGLEGVIRVPGIGRRTLKPLEVYFSKM